MGIQGQERERDKSDNAAPQRRSLLPQKSNFRRSESQHVQEGSQLQSQPPQRQESRLQLQPEKQRSGPSISPHRLGLVRPPSESSTTSTPSSIGTPSETKAPGGLPTPQQQQLKKTQMLPPPRLERSASLRQTTSSRPGVAGGQPRGHTRHRSTQIDGSRLATQAGSKQGESNPPTPTTSSAVKSGKPQFNTFQQHYSPRKPSKPSSSTTATAKTVSPPDPDLLLASSRPEIAALQTELLQLHLTHSSSIQTQTQWKISAEKQLQQRYKSVAGTYRSVLSSERDAQRHINIKALRDLSDNSNRHSGGRHDFTEQLQILSRTVQDVADLTDPRGGRYTSVLREFEEWIEGFNRLRGDGNLQHDADVTADFIAPIGRDWQAEISRLNTKLDLCLRDLQSLDVDIEHEQKNRDDGESVSSSSSSALCRAVRGHTALVFSMIEELETIWKIEAEVVRVERERVREAVDRIVIVEEGHGGVDGNNRTRQGIWKTE